MQTIILHNRLKHHLTECNLIINKKERSEINHSINYIVNQVPKKKGKALAKVLAHLIGNYPTTISYKHRIVKISKEKG